MKEKKTTFKIGESNWYPKAWQKIRLGNDEVCEIIMGLSPPSSTYNQAGDGLPFLQGNMEFGEIYPSPTTYCSKPVKTAERDDILISVRAPVGDVNISPSKVCIGRGLAAIRCKPDKLLHTFLFYCLKHGARKLENISAGSTFKAIRKDDIDRFDFPLPPLPEQQKIADILSTVDKRLELLRERKERLERIKKGLMNDLLTGERRVTNLIERLTLRSIEEHRKTLEGLAR